MSWGPQKIGAVQLGAGMWSQRRHWSAPRFDYLWCADEETTFHMRNSLPENSQAKPGRGPEKKKQKGT